MHSIRAFNDRRKAKRANSANTIAAIEAMGKSGALRDAGPAPTDDERRQLRSDIRDVKYEATYGHSGRDHKGYHIGMGEALKNAGRALDKNIAAIEKDPSANAGVRSATTWTKRERGE
jgi:hypothetical protein